MNDSTYKLIVTILVLVIVIGGGMLLYNNLQDSVDLGEMIPTESVSENLAPDFTVTDSSGNSVKLSDFRGMKGQVKTADMNFLSAFLFGIVFSVGWTPCVGVFLGSALMLASQQGSAMVGTMMLLCYSAGLGVPFLVSAVLIDQLKGAFNFIKRNYNLVNKVCGTMLLIVGVLMATGLLTRMLNTLN